MEILIQLNRAQAIGGCMLITLALVTLDSRTNFGEVLIIALSFCVLFNTFALMICHLETNTHLFDLGVDWKWIWTQKSCVFGS